MRSSRRSRTAVSVVLYAIMGLLTVILLFPFCYMLSKSLMTSEEVIQQRLATARALWAWRPRRAPWRSRTRGQVKAKGYKKDIWIYIKLCL